MSDRIINSALIVLTISSVLISGLLIKREAFPRVSHSASLSYVRNWKEIARTGSILGSGDGSITVIEFADFQCPFCARADTTLRSLRAKYPKKVRIVYRHLPLSRIHPDAAAAALASECAAEQGAFESYHNALFENQQSIGLTSWVEFAKTAGVSEVARFRECVGGRRYVNRIAADQQVARDLGINGTPAFIVNGHLVVGSVPLSYIETLLDL